MRYTPALRLCLALAAIVAATVAIPSLISTGRYVDLLVYLHLCTGCSENHKHSLDDQDFSLFLHIFSN